MARAGSSASTSANPLSPQAPHPGGTPQQTTQSRW